MLKCKNSPQIKMHTDTPGSVPQHCVHTVTAVCMKITHKVCVFAYRLLNVKVASCSCITNPPPPPLHPHSDVLILRGKDPVFSVRFLSGNIGHCEDPGTRLLLMTEVEISGQG